MSFFCPCPGVSPQRCFALVVTNFVSLISVQAQKLTHAIVPPLPKSLTTFRGPRRSWQNHIPSSRSFNFNQLSSNKKKPAHKCVPTSRKRIDLSLLRWRFHIHVTGFEIQSRNCPLHFSDCRQLGAIQKRRYFLDDDNRLHTRWRCPAFSRSLNKICENNYSVVVIDKLSLYII